ncbi:MAG TPA: acireductone synthase [Planctomycetales bacterium]|jgi:enolase-phosphatase E1|nr:acireductone synthase [Planctomycetales bacterium]
MIASGLRAVLLDIEGTTSSVQFVYEVLFPFARRELTDFLRRRWGDPDVARACEMIARDAVARSGDRATTEGDHATPESVAAEAIRLMDGDEKATGLKELQGLIWQEGYAAGRLTSHVYPDVAPALRCWAEQGMDLRIFSSGSVAAQKVFFAHTDAGDLLPLFHGHYDTTTGPKREAESYRRIAADMKLPTTAILFLSDVRQELDAAAEAGMRTGLVVRPGNAPVTAGHAHPVVTDFGQIDLQRL